MHPATKGAITCLNMKSLRVFSLNRSVLFSTYQREPRLFCCAYPSCIVHRLGAHDVFLYEIAFISIWYNRSLSFPFTLVSDIVPVPAPVLIPIPVLGLISRFVLVLSVPTPFSSFLLSLPPSVSQSLLFLSLVYYSPFGITSSDRRQVLLQELLATCRRQLLSAEMMPRTRWEYRLFPNVADTKLSASSSCLSIMFPVPISDPGPALVPTPILVLGVRPLSRLLLCVLLCVYICVCIYYIVYDHTSRSFNPSHYIPSTLILSRGTKELYYKIWNRMGGEGTQSLYSS